MGGTGSRSPTVSYLCMWTRSINQPVSRREGPNRPFPIKLMEIRGIKCKTIFVPDSTPDDPKVSPAHTLPVARACGQALLAQPLTS